MTAEFARCMDVLMAESHARRGALLEFLGEQDYVERLERRRSTRAAVERGLLKREIFVAHQARALSGADPTFDDGVAAQNRL